MKLIFLHGSPGVGKLTIGLELQKVTNYKLFHNHLTVDLVSSVFQFGSNPFIHLREKIWLDVLQMACLEKIEGLIFTFAFEKTVNENYPQKVLNLVTGHGGQVYFIELLCEPDELRRRLVDPSRKKYTKLNSIEKFNMLMNSGALLKPQIPEESKYSIKIDTTSKSPKNVADTIMSFIS